MNLPPTDVLDAAAEAIRRNMAGDRSGACADEILAEHYGTKDYPTRALSLANKRAGSLPPPKKIDSKPCVCGCGRILRKREGQTWANFAQQSYFERECYYASNRKDS